MGCCSSGASPPPLESKAPHGIPAGGEGAGPEAGAIDPESKDGGDATSAGTKAAASDGRSPDARESLAGASTAGASGPTSGAASSSRDASALDGEMGALNKGTSSKSSGFSQLVGKANTGPLILSRINVRPYGVLGTQRLKRTGRIEDIGGMPGPDVVVVDPAGLPYIKEGPAKAGGAAGAIYEWLGIRNDASFPEDVVNSINQPRMAKLHVYDGKACIHCVGPDFNQAGSGTTYEWALGELADAYRAALKELASSGYRRLRMPPLSGGTFAGRFVYDLPALTSQALQQAFVDLSEDHQEFLLEHAELDMCIFMEKELPEYQEAFRDQLNKEEL